MKTFISLFSIIFLTFVLITMKVSAVIIILLWLILFTIHVLQNVIGGWKGNSIEEIIGVPADKIKPEDIEKLSKYGLNQLFHVAEKPELTDFKGELRGKSLENGTLSFIPRLITNKLLGPGQWCGKGFDYKNEWGYNIFKEKNRSGHQSLHRTQRLKLYTTTSRFDKNDSLHIYYSYYNKKLRLLKDEVRKINDSLYICLGYWTPLGDHFNPSPFYLYNEKTAWQGVDRNMNLENKWALVTGASGGIGANMAFILAQYGCCARGQQQLEKLADKLETKFSINVIIESMDLSKLGAALELQKK